MSDVPIDAWAVVNRIRRTLKQSACAHNDEIEVTTFDSPLRTWLCVACSRIRTEWKGYRG